ncbi:MAG TPA: hypothetical protein VGT05_04120 [Patescibacteria group bacterium]|nr:hypothetical protein [Patescibacteria group bacterium]
MFIFFLLIFLVCLLLVQTTLIALPLVLESLIVVAVVFQKEWIIFIAFCIGLLQDMMLLQNLGQSSLFFLFTLGILFLYSRKFEVNTIPFVFFFSLFAISTDLLLFSRGSFLPKLLLATFTTFVMFFFCNFLSHFFLKKT